MFFTRNALFYTPVLRVRLCPGEGEVYILAGRRTQWQIFFILLVPLLAALATWSTGFWQNPSLGYGFPLAWNECSFLELPAPQGGWDCYFHQGWFALDVAFYTIIGYAIVLLCYHVVTRVVPKSGSPPANSPSNTVSDTQASLPSRVPSAARQATGPLDPGFIRIMRRAPDYSG